MEKSYVFFSKNSSPLPRELVKAALGVRELDCFESYLGLPTLIGCVKYRTFSFLRDRVWNKMHGWKGNMLSKASNEVLIKAVIQAIFTYTMGIFLLPMKLSNELNSMCARFWWGITSHDHKIHWMRWKKLTLPKSEGTQYFPCGHFLDAQDCPNSSYTWKGMMAAKPILATCWHVGNGASIHALHDPWIPNRPS
ncbi:hypothetical protein SO802_005257 [Lithocarpus litseifolius]|uniref:Reverse transcriptase n=1 Tax=Lithocarpus litseifolius TaxID=425828 RepID=A0AAW2DKW3_9ROSI